MADKPRTTITAVYGKTEDRYLDLVRQVPLRPLRTDADLDAAVTVIDGLLDRPKLTAPERDYLDVLSDLVEAYETETIPMRPVSDGELLRFLIEQKSVTQAAVAAGAGIAESTVSEVLAGKRKLNRAQIAKLAGYFHVEPGAFLHNAYDDEQGALPVRRYDLQSSAASRPRRMAVMAKSYRNTGKSWTSADISQLKTLARQNTPTRVIGLKLGRTESSVRSKARQEGVSLKPLNQPPYNRRK